MAPCTRLEEKLRKLGLSTDDGGCSRSSPASKSKHHFRIFFPLPPYDGLQFNALRSGTGFNFTGQLLGVGGKQLQRIKQESAARVEVNNAEGNLNGSHPDPLDQNLHALISADSLSKLHKAAMMVWELLAPVNGKFLPIDVVPGGSVRLTVAQPGKAAAAAAKAVPQLKQGFKAGRADAAPSGSDNSSNSSSKQDLSAESRPVSVSPLLTPVTPAAAAGQRPSRSSIEVTPDSSCSSMHSVGSESSRCVPCLFSNLDGFLLPPAAIPPAAQTSAGCAGHAAAHATQEQQQQQQQGQVVDEAVSGSSGLQEDQLLQPATPGSGAGAAAACSSESSSIYMSEQPQPQQQQQQQQQQQGPLPAGHQLGDSLRCRAFPAPSEQTPGTATSQLSQETHCQSSGTAGSAAWPAPTPALTAPSETVLTGAAGAAAAQACLLPPGAVLQKPDWHEKQQQQQQQLDSPALRLDLSEDSSLTSCFHYGLGLSSSSLDSSSSFTAKDSPALQALIVDHQRQQQQQQMAEQQMQLAMHMMHMQQQAQGGSLGSSQSTFGSSASLFGGPSPLLGPRTCSCMGSFEGDGLQLGPSALGGMASSMKPQLGVTGLPGCMPPAGIGSLGLATGQPCCHVPGSLACTAGLMNPESPGGAGGAVYGSVPLQEQQRLLAADAAAAAACAGLRSCLEGPAPQSSSMGLQYPGPGMVADTLHAGSVLGGLHLPGSGVSCWAAGPNELAGGSVLLGMTPPPASAADSSMMSNSCWGGESARASGGSDAMHHHVCPVTPGSQGRTLPPAWQQAQHDNEQQQQQQQQEMLMMLHAVQQGHSVQHQQQLALPLNVYAGPSVAQPGRVSIW
uniref:KHDC4/BBP-like KH-domain type I domain-containing protein n=1 Tax=Tetradesmus obliquus TaxID=3088 RepID=A0A383VUH0_TETOB|eukprot:jgi/Sobl393_1/12215/SZX69148.1